MVQGRVRKCQACNKCHLFGSAVGRQMVPGTVDGGDGLVGVIRRKSFFRLFRNAFSKDSLTSASCYTDINSAFNSWLTFMALSLVA